MPSIGTREISAWAISFFQPRRPVGIINKAAAFTFHIKQHSGIQKETNKSINMTVGKNTCEDRHTITSADGTLVPVPEEYICPLTLDVMAEPLLSREGHNYEREAILNWVSENGTSPLTREPLRPSQLVLNRALKFRIQFFLRQHRIVEEGVVKDDAKQFMGYVVSDRKSNEVMAESMTLNRLTSVLLQVRQTSTPVPEPQSNHSVDHVAERRRQIADMLADAMAELNDI
eukprot:scaffold34593_cov179-Amphora_coffeaeformis.AAC.14